MLSLKEKHVSRFHTNICTLLFVINFQVNIWSAVKSIHASPYSHFHFIINFEEHYFKSKCFVRPHVPPLYFPSLVLSKTFSYVRLIIRDQVFANSKLHTSPAPCESRCTWLQRSCNCKTWCAWSCNCKTRWSGLIPIHFSSQLREYTHTQLGGLSCKHSLAEPQYFDHLQSDKHIQSVARNWKLVKHTSPYYCGYSEYSTEKHWSELGTKHNATVIMKSLLLLGKHGFLPSRGLDYIFTF